MSLLKPLQKSALELNHAFTIWEHSSHDKAHTYTHNKEQFLEAETKENQIHNKISFTYI